MTNAKTDANIDTSYSITERALVCFFRFAEDIFDEKRFRLLLGMFCVFIFLERGSISLLSKITGASRERIRNGKNEILGMEPDIFEERIRRKGAGRKPVEKHIEGISEAIQDIVERSSYGNPEDTSLTVHNTASLRSMCEDLAKLGKNICRQTVLRIVHKLGFSQQQNKKARQVGKPHKDRNEQFQIIDKVRKTAASFIMNPLLSIDAKAKIFLNGLWQKGKQWRYKGDPATSPDHDYPVKGKKATPYGIYDVLRNFGYVSLGISSDTAEFAVEALRRWWYRCGKAAYAMAEKLVILCDGGGSNGSHLRLWKYELAQLAKEIGLPIEVHHYPPGCSKHNLIEHRLFNHLSRTWAGKTFTDIYDALCCIRSARTRTGLRVQADCDFSEYLTGIKVTEEQFNSIDIIHGERLGDWNYTIRGFKEAEMSVAA